MPKLLINEMRGLNTTTAKFQLKPGEFEFVQNVRARPFYNLAKRKGVEPVTSFASPVMGIFDFDLDEVIIPVIQWGGTLTFFSSAITTDPYPYQSIDNSFVNIFMIESAMRASQERYMWSYGDPTVSYSWPVRVYNEDGTTCTPAEAAVPTIPANSLRPWGVSYTNPIQMPPDDFYNGDVEYWDVANGQPVGTRAAYLVNWLAARTPTEDYVKPAVNGVLITAAPDEYVIATDFPLVVTATPANYRSVLSAIKGMLNTIKAISIDANWTNGQNRLSDFTALNPSVCNLSDNAEAVAAWGAASWVNGWAGGTSNPGCYFDTLDASYLPLTHEIWTQRAQVIAGQTWTVCNYEVFLGCNGTLDVGSSYFPVTADSKWHIVANGTMVGDFSSVTDFYCSAAWSGIQKIALMYPQFKYQP